MLLMYNKLEKVYRREADRLQWTVIQINANLQKRKDMIVIPYMYIKEVDDQCLTQKKVKKFTKNN